MSKKDMTLTSVKVQSELFNEFKILGIDKIYCLSVNDAFVMNAWAKSQNLKFNRS